MTGRSQDLSAFYHSCKENVLSYANNKPKKLNLRKASPTPDI